MARNVTVQQAVLDAIGGLACIGIDDLVAATGLTHRQVSKGACGLIARGYLERAEVGCYRLTQGGAAVKAEGKPLSSGPVSRLTQRNARQPRKSTFRKRMWRAMRVAAQSGGKFSIPDLVAAAARGTEKDPENNATRYVGCLYRAGYLLRHRARAEGGAVTSNGFHRYSLIRNEGPEAPVLRRGQREVYDPNTEEVHQCRNG